MSPQNFKSDADIYAALLKFKIEYSAMSIKIYWFSSKF